jgi:hypothetical protein
MSPPFDISCKPIFLMLLGAHMLPEAKHLQSILRTDNIVIY